MATAASFSSCDSVIYEDLDPCEVNHRLRFRWDHNILFTDAFQGNVGSVAVYGFDADTDTFAWVLTEKGEALSADGYTLDLNGVAPGKYTIVAWCGLENDGERPESFLVSDLVPGVSTRKDFICRMEREIREDGTHHSSTDLYDLFHGTVSDVTIYDNNDPEHTGDHTYTVDLKKDTNSVRIILQQLSGDDINADQFTYTVEESNGLLNHDNSLLDDETITYHEWQKQTGVAGLASPEDYPEVGTRAWPIENPISTDLSTRAITDVKVAIADLTVSRLMANRKSILTVRNGEGKTVARIPLTDYALLIKDKYKKPMTDQEYLDRQDNYTLTFFLDSHYYWTASTIIINSWRVVLQDIDFQ